MFRLYKQVIIRPMYESSLQMLCLMGSHLVHIFKMLKISTIQLKSWGRYHQTNTFPKILTELY